MGIHRIQACFEKARSDKRAALMPYFTLGYPSITESFEIVRGIADHGADLIELGVPFSDPLADGPVIQHSTQVALEQGMNVEKALNIAQNLRKAGLTQALLLMGYINPILSYGIEKYVNDAADCGIDGLIVPDLPMHEAGELEKICYIKEMALIAMLAPNSTDQRIGMVNAHARGFLYLVSLTGVTGERESLPEDLSNFIRRVRAVCNIPLAVGFGISTPAQAHTVAQLADGVIIGSAIIRTASEGGVRAVNELVRQLRQAMKKTDYDPIVNRTP